MVTESDSELISEELQPQGPVWYAVHTYSGYENKVKSHLEARVASMDMRGKIFRVIVPMEEEVEIKQGQRRTVQRKVFPGYVLVEMIMSDEAWYVVRNTPGVTSFVGGSGIRPVPLQEHEVKAILKQVTQETEKPKVKANFTKGQSVRVIDGPFTEFIAPLIASTRTATKSPSSSRSSVAKLPSSWISSR
jgi:transcriptional antiterminator NusG